MKNVLLCLLVLCSFSVFGQLTKSRDKPDTTILSPHIQFDSIKKPPPVYTKYKAYKTNRPRAVILIDSIRFSEGYSMFIDPKDISHINIIKNKIYPDGAIYIELKDHKLLSKLLDSKLMSLHDIINKYIAKKENHKPIIFLLDKKLLTDTVGVRIPEICLGNVTIAEAAQMPYFKTAFPQAMIMMISTHYANEPYQPEIILQ